MNQDASSVKLFYGYRLLFTSSQSDGQYHDRSTARVEIRPEGSDEVLHVVGHSTRSTHQLSTRYKPAANPVSGAITEAEHWVLANRPDAVARREEEAKAVAESNRLWRRETFESVGRDPIAYILKQSGTFSTTDVGQILDLGSARKLNQLLIEWGLQRRVRDAYEPINPTHGEQVGLYGTLRWEVEGLKAIWDAAVTHGTASGGDEEFMRRIRANTSWFEGIDQ